MSEEREIWISAQKMIDRFGQGALDQIDLRIAELRNSEEPQAIELWTRIRNAAIKLLDDDNPGSRH